MSYAETLRPLGDRVIVRQDPPKTLSASGRLHLPDSAKQYDATGVVLAVGPRAESVTKGERVLFKRRSMSSLAPDDYSGTAPDANVLVLHDEDMIAVIGDAQVEVVTRVR